jgi:glycosyltransferase involved in cell wall biosynthesis
MLILQIHNHYQQYGGEDAVVASEKALLEESGHTVESFTIHNEIISGLRRELQIFRDVVYNAEIYQTLAKRIATNRPDIVHVHNTFPLLSPSVYDACMEANVPVIQTLHNYRVFCAAATLFRDGHPCELCLDGRSYRAVWHRCYRNSVPGSLAVANMIVYHRYKCTWSKKVTRFIALTEFARGMFIKAGLPSERIFVKPNFVIDPGAPGLDHRNGALFVGRLTPEKGVKDLIRAWSSINIPLHILGDGPERALLEKQSPSNVFFEGRVGPERVRQAMCSAKFIVIPSLWYEGFPVTLVEAFANGLPVIASRLGSLAELVDDNVTGRLIPPGDPTALAAVIAELLTDSDRLKTIGFAARKRYESSYTPRRNLDQLVTVYQDALQEAQQD